MPRFFVGTDQISDKNIVITGTDVNHIRNVLRMVPGEEVTIITKGVDEEEAMDKIEEYLTTSK